MSLLVGDLKRSSVARQHPADAPARPATPRPALPPSYELIVAERGMDGEIKRMILRPLVEEEASRAVPVSLREPR